MVRTQDCPGRLSALHRAQEDATEFLDAVNCSVSQCSFGPFRYRVQDGTAPSGCWNPRLPIGPSE